MPWIHPTLSSEISAAAKKLVREGVEVIECANVREAIESLEEGERAIVAGRLYLAADMYRLQRGLL
jgi:hypothetical protein